MGFMSLFKKKPAQPPKEEAAAGVGIHPPLSAASDGETSPPDVVSEAHLAVAAAVAGKTPVPPSVPPATAAADTEWLLESVLFFLKSPAFNVPLHDFVDVRCVIFDSEEENKLPYSEAHEVLIWFSS